MEPEIPGLFLFYLCIVYCTLCNDQRRQNAPKQKQKRFDANKHLWLLYACYEKKKIT